MTKNIGVKLLERYYQLRPQQEWVSARELHVMCQNPRDETTKEIIKKITDKPLEELTYSYLYIMMRNYYVRSRNPQVIRRKEPHYGEWVYQIAKWVRDLDKFTT